MTTLRATWHLLCGVAGAVALGALASAQAQQTAQPAAAASTAPPPGSVIPPMLAKPVPKPVARPAAKSADKPIWSQLSPAQQLALEPLHAEWDPMEGVRKQKWLELANRYAAMKPEEQQRVHERMREWIKLTPAQRKVARQNYTQAKTISPDEKSATWESYKQLPDDQKQKLAEQAARKPLTNVPPAKTIPRTAPILHGALACPAGSIRNTASATPACVSSAAAPPAIPAAAPSAVVTAPVAAPGAATASAPVK
jgi:hypothetical protein